MIVVFIINDCKLINELILKFALSFRMVYSQQVTKSMEVFFY